MLSEEQRGSLWPIGGSVASNAIVGVPVVFFTLCHTLLRSSCVARGGVDGARSPLQGTLAALPPKFSVHVRDRSWTAAYRWP